MRQKIANLFLIASVFLVPWQTIWIRRVIALPEGETSFGTLGLYVLEGLIVLTLFLRGRPKLPGEMIRVLRALVLFFAAMLFVFTSSRFELVSIFSALHLFIAGLFFLVLCDDRTNKSRIIHAFLSGLIGPCLLGWMQFASGQSPASSLLGLAEKLVATKGVAVVETSGVRLMRAYGSFPHPNIFGGYLVVVLVLVRLCWASATTRLQKISYPFLAILFSSTLILTFSRSAWLAFVGTSILFLLNRRGLKPWLAKPERLFFLSVIGVVIIMGGMLRNQIGARVQATEPVEAISVTERTNQYHEYPNVFLIAPLTGVGQGTYVFALESLFKGKESWSYQPIHNAFLLSLSEIGVIGFAALIYLLAQIVRRVLALPGLAAQNGAELLVALFVLASLDHYLWSLWPGVVLTVFALAMSLKGLGNRG